MTQVKHARSLTSHLVWGTTVAATVILAATAVTIHLVMAHALSAEGDAVLFAQAQSLTPMVEDHEGRIVVELDLQAFPDFTRERSPSYFRMLDSAGRELARSPSLGGAELPFPTRESGSIFADMPLPDGRPGRSVTFVHTPLGEDGRPPGAPLRILVAAGTEAQAQRVQQLDGILAVVCLGASLAAAVVMLVLVRSLTAPFTVIADRLALLRTEDASTGLDLAQIPRELHPVVRRLDELLHRLAESFVRERTFTADAAHELRTPLAGLRTTLEIAGMRPRDAVESQTFFVRCLTVVEQMQGLVESLLHLARAEGPVIAPPVGINLAECLRAAWERQQPSTGARDLTCLLTGAVDAHVLADPTHLNTVVDNLIANAVAYTVPGGGIRGHLQAEGDRLHLALENDALGLPPEAATRAFERFWRADSVRNTEDLHAGLGLALCQRLVTALGGSIAASITPTTFCIHLILPRSAEHSLAQLRQDDSAQRSNAGRKDSA